MNKYRTSKKRFGFTMLELIVVIVVLGVIAGLAVPSFLSVTTKSKYAVAAEEARGLARKAIADASFGADFNGTIDGVFTGTSGDCTVDATVTGGVITVETAAEAGCDGGSDTSTPPSSSTPPTTTPVQGLSLSVETGSSFSCALTASGGVKCWGWNYYGQLGDGSNDTSSTAVAVSGLSSGVTALRIGTHNACAVTSAGALKCWGNNENYQLGDGTQISSNVPVQAAGLTSGVTDVAVGSSHTCALLSSGSVECWGYSGDGQTGEMGSPDTGWERPSPVTVSGITDAVSISAGSNHTCAVLSNNSVKCWGYNGSGQLGDGTTTSTHIPVTVTGLSATSVSAGSIHTCAVTTSGAATCWGYNSNGQLGNGTYTDSATPVAVTGLSSNVTEISAGWGHSCAVKSDGTAYCWGHNEGDSMYGTGGGQLGDGTTTNSNVPVSVVGLSSVSSIAPSSATIGHTCAVVSNTTVKCWGINTSGMLGDGTTTSSLTPVTVLGL